MFSVKDERRKQKRSRLKVRTIRLESYQDELILFSFQTDVFPSSLPRKGGKP